MKSIIFILLFSVLLIAVYFIKKYFINNGQKADFLSKLVAKYFAKDENKNHFDLSSPPQFCQYFTSETSQNLIEDYINLEERYKTGNLNKEGYDAELDKILSQIDLKMKDLDLS